MNDESQRPTAAVVVGIGSSHGDDQLGWQVVAMLRRHPRFRHQAVEIEETTRMIDYLPGCSHLVVVDASSGGAPPGTITRVPWPDKRIEIQHGDSTHGMSVGDALRLADQLGLLPADVVIFAVQGGHYEPAADMSPAVLAALPELVDRVVEELEKGTGG